MKQMLCLNKSSVTLSKDAVSIRDVENRSDLPMRCEAIIYFGDITRTAIGGGEGWHEHVQGPRSSFRWGTKTLPKPKLGNGLAAMGY